MPGSVPPAPAASAPPVAVVPLPAWVSWEAPGWVAPPGTCPGVVAPGCVALGWVGVGLWVDGVVIGVEGVLPPLPCPNGKNEPPDMRVAMIPAITATRATPISKSGQLRLSQSMNPILRLAPRDWSNLGSGRLLPPGTEGRG